MADDRTYISEGDRDRVLSTLSDHFAVGRLSLDEFDQRVDRAFQAATSAQLQSLLSDLPTDSGGPPHPVTRTTAPGLPHLLSRTPWAPWGLTAVICLMIWLATSIGQGSALYFWPFWVVAPWGAALASRSLRGGSAHVRPGCRF